MCLQAQFYPHSLAVDGFPGTNDGRFRSWRYVPSDKLWQRVASNSSTRTVAAQDCGYESGRVRQPTGDRVCGGVEFIDENGGGPGYGARSATA
jgi:hypothetical protein